MTQSVPVLGPRGVATAEEIAWGHGKRAGFETPARMREAAEHLLSIETWGIAKRTGATIEEIKRAGLLLQREAGRWEAEGLIDCT